MYLADLAQKLRTYLDVDDAELTDAEVAVIVATAEAEVFRALEEHPRMIKEEDLTAVGNLITLPENFRRVLEVDKYKQVQNRKALATGKYLLRTDQIEFKSNPSGPVKVAYSAAPDKISNDKTNWIALLYPDIYLYASLKEAAIYMRNPAGAQTWGAEFGARVGTLILTGWNSTIANGPGFD